MILDTKVRAIRSPIINIYCKRPLTLAWPRYASQDYRTFSDHLYENDKINHTVAMMIFIVSGRKNSLSANIMQPLSNNLGNVSLSALWRNYWGRSEMLKITNSVTPITGNTLVILSLPANPMMKTIKKRSVLICLSPFLSTGVMILPKHVTKLTYRILPHFQRWLFLQQYWNYWHSR